MYTSMQHIPSNIEGILVSFIESSYLRILVYGFYRIFKMEISLILAVLPELIDTDDDKKPTRGKTRL